MKTDMAKPQNEKGSFLNISKLGSSQIFQFRDDINSLKGGTSASYELG